MYGGCRVVGMEKALGISPSPRARSIFNIISARCSGGVLSVDRALDLSVEVITDGDQLDAVHELHEKGWIVALDDGRLAVAL